MLFSFLLFITVKHPHFANTRADGPNLSSSVRLEQEKESHHLTLSDKL